MKNKTKLLAIFALLVVSLSILFVACVPSRVRFLDGDKVLFAYENGEVSMPAEPVVKEGFAFDGWYLDNDVWELPVTEENIKEVMANGAVDIFAKWTQINTVHTVIFLDFDGSELSRMDVGTGENASFEGAPTRPDDINYSYIFKEWDLSLDNITEDVIIRAKYSKTLIDTDSISFEVKFYNESVLIDTITVIKGEDVSLSNIPVASKLSTKQYDYEFIGWDNDLTNITKDAVVNAVYQENLRKYNAKFYINGALYSSSEFYYGQSIIAPDNMVVTKPSSTQYDFIFSGWDKDITAIMTGDIVLTAEFKSDVRKFSVEFIFDGKVIDEQLIEYGNQANAPDISQYTIPTPKYSFEFSGWSRRFNNITSDIIVNAEVIKTIRKYTINYYDQANLTNIQHTEQLEYDSYIDYEIEKTGSTWDGWYVDNDIAKFYDGRSKVSCDADLYSSNIASGLEFNGNSVSGYTGVVGFVVIPDRYKGVAINKINKAAFAAKDTVTGVYIPNSITEIESAAFTGTATDIYVQAKSKPTGWEKGSIIKPAWDANQASDALSGTSRVSYWGAIGFDSVDKYTALFLDDGTSKRAVVTAYSGTVAGNLNMPNTLTYNATEYDIIVIGDSIFENNPLLLKVVLPNKLLTISNNAFAMNMLLREVVFPTTLNKIGTMAFVGCVGLKSAFIPSMDVKVAVLAFLGVAVDFDLKFACAKPGVTSGWGIAGVGWNYTIAIESLANIDLSNISGILGMTDALKSFTHVTFNYVEPPVVPIV